MAALVYSARALEDLLRLTEFLDKDDPQSALATTDLIRTALLVLQDHPLIGRRVDDGPERELVISRGHSGYLALYRFDAAADEVIIHAVRHQREAGFEEE
jgi:plasmid stabilization system protein ParE